VTGHRSCCATEIRPWPPAGTSPQASVAGSSIETVVAAERGADRHDSGRSPVGPAYALLGPAHDGGAPKNVPSRAPKADPEPYETNKYQGTER